MSSYRRHRLEVTSQIAVVAEGTASSQFALCLSPLGGRLALFLKHEAKKERYDRHKQIESDPV